MILLWILFGLLCLAAILMWAFFIILFIFGPWKRQADGTVVSFWRY